LLAYLGDAVFELYVRQSLLLPPKRIRNYHQEVVSKVRAEAQLDYLQTLMPYLTEAECEVVRRGRNATTTRSRRAAPDVYQQASALETLIGYLYLTDRSRLSHLFSLLTLDLPSSPSS